jgi:tetratricopeptide (TPR) repeat protein
MDAMRIVDDQYDHPIAEAEGASVDGLYTLAMLADVLKVSKSVLRRWHRRGYLESSHTIHRLCYFRFEEIRVARILAELSAGGCSLATLDRRVSELTRAFANVDRPLADLPLTVEGKRLYVRRGDTLLEPGGQILLGFGPTDEDDFDLPEGEAILSIRPDARNAELVSVTGDVDLVESQRLNRLRALALEFEEQGELEQALEAYRLIVDCGDVRAEDQFLMADALYRSGDLTAARERYRMAVELDPEYVEAWANLGCTLAELGASAQAQAAFETALASFSDYADVHYHLANLFGEMQQPEKAQRHLRRFLELAPASPWAEQAKHQLEVC